jgi:hypothetical protein
MLKVYSLSGFVGWKWSLLGFCAGVIVQLLAVIIVVSGTEFVAVAFALNA